MNDDPILVRMRQLREQGLSGIEPRLDEFQVPWCDVKCAYYEQPISTVTLKFVPHCMVMDAKPESVCVPGVHILVDMANQLACLQHGEPMPDPVNHQTREPHQPTHAVVVEGELPFFENGDGTREIDYQVRLDRNGPGDVEFRLFINGELRGKLPFDNLVKAATRIDPEHAVGPEKQIQKLRREIADALAEKYDWQAKAEQLEAKVLQLEAQIAAYAESTKA